MALGPAYGRVGLGAASRYLDPATGTWRPTFVRVVDGITFTGDPGPALENLPDVETLKTWTDADRQALYDALRTQHVPGVAQVTDDAGLNLWGGEISSMTPAEANTFLWLRGIITADPSMRSWMLLPAAAQTQERLAAAVAGSVGQGLPAPVAPPAGPAHYLIGGREVYADGSAVPGGYNAQTDAQNQLAQQGYPDMRVTADGRWYNIGDEPAQSYNEAHGLAGAAAGGSDAGPASVPELPPGGALRAGMPLLVGLAILGAIAARGRRR